MGRGRERERKRERNNIFYPLTHFPNAHNSQGGVSQSQEPGTPSGLPHGWQRPKYLSHHHLLPPTVLISRKLGLEAELGDLKQALCCERRQAEPHLER